MSVIEKHLEKIMSYPFWDDYKNTSLLDTELAATDEQIMAAAKVLLHARKGDIISHSELRDASGSSHAARLVMPMAIGLQIAEYRFYKEDGSEVRQEQVYDALKDEVEAPNMKVCLLMTVDPQIDLVTDQAPEP